jgi:hypothetical protein
MRISRSHLCIGALLAAGFVLTACSTAGTQPSSAPPTTTPSTVVTTLPPMTPGPPPVTTPPAVAVTKQYDAAKSQWQAGATAISAQQGAYWSQAAADLTAGETTDSDPTGYAAAVAMLTQLIALPDAQQSAAQNAAFHADINGLNAFFHTPGLYS